MKKRSAWSITIGPKGPTHVVAFRILRRLRNGNDKFLGIAGGGVFLSICPTRRSARYAQTCLARGKDRTWKAGDIECLQGRCDHRLKR